MSKKTKKETVVADSVSNEQQQPIAEQSANIEPAYVKELLEKGVVVLSGRSREELAEMLDNIPADVRYAAGAVGFNPETGVFTLRVDINP